MCMHDISFYYDFTKFLAMTEIAYCRTQSADINLNTTGGELINFDDVSVACDGFWSDCRE